MTKHFDAERSSAALTSHSLPRPVIVADAMKKTKDADEVKNERKKEAIKADPDIFLCGI